MFSKKFIFLGMLLVLIVLSLLTIFQHVGRVQAKNQNNSSSKQNYTIPYSARLSDQSGKPLTGDGYAFRFILFENKHDTRALWDETHTNLDLDNGFFAVNLGNVSPLPAQVNTFNQLWLEIALRAPGEAEFVSLSPRQQLTNLSTQELPNRLTATSNGMACPHDHFTEIWSGSDGNYGLQIINSGDGFYGKSSGGFGIVGESEENLASGVYGTNSGGVGIWGNSTSNAGVYGVSASGNGLKGYSSSGTAIQASGTGVISSTAESVLVLSPYDMIIRGGSDVELIPLDNGGMRIHSESGTEDKYFAVPVPTYEKLFGTKVYIKSLRVCYQKTDILPSGYIDVTGVYKNNGSTGWSTYMEDTIDRSDTSHSCYTVTDTTPYTQIDNSTWVQFNIKTTQAPWNIIIYTIKLTLKETSY